MKQLLPLILLALITSCSEQADKPLLYKVETQDFAIEIPAKGELFAANATVISAPVSRSGPQVLSWLAPEFTFVKKGEVIAKFDGEVMSKKRQERQNEFDMTMEDINDKSGQLNKELTDINKDIEIVDEEKNFAEKFAIDDERILSKLDILESMQNTEYLGTKRGYLSWKEQSFSASSQGEMGLLDMKKQDHLNKLGMLEDSLAKLEIVAPHDGMLVYNMNWRGEKSRPGQTFWSGRKIAELPDISVMKVKLFVVESEAIALAEKQNVTFQLYADVTQTFTGIVESVAAFPSSIRRGDPQKYFEVVVSIDKQEPTLFIPGRKLRADILVKSSEPKLAVPLQAIFSKDNQYFVYLYQQGQFKPQPVEVGMSSLSHAVITSGLEQGQQISLTDRELSL